MRCDHTLIEMGVRGDGSKDGEKWTDLKYILKTGWIGTLCGSLGGRKLFRERKAFYAEAAACTKVLRYRTNNWIWIK